jgi:molecular chaperone GrpE
MTSKPEHDPHELSPPDHQSSPEEYDEVIAESLEEATGDVVQELEDNRISVERRLEDAQHQVLLAQAELENFRKRMHREMDQQLKYANLPLVRDLLDVIDNLHRATEAASSAEPAPMENAVHQALLDGVKMVLRQMEVVFVKYGWKPIQSLGQPFDPNFHEAISQMPSAEYAAGTVAHEVAVGYLLHDRVVRPSSVIVSTGPGN